MKTATIFILFLSIVGLPGIPSKKAVQTSNISKIDDLKSLEIATKAIRDAFAAGDISKIVSLHHPDVIKYFGGKNVVIGRAELAKSLTWVTQSKIEFVENKVESTVINDNTAIQTVIFKIKSTPKGGGKSTVGGGRSMVVYVRSHESPTGWLSIREMAQAGPDE